MEIKTFLESNENENKGRIQNGDWDTDEDCVSSMNQEPCWDTEDMYEVKHKGDLKHWHPEPLACGRLFHTTIHWRRRQAATSTLPLSTSPLGLCPTEQPDHHPPTHQHTSCNLPLEDSNTTKCCLQTCLGNLDKQDSMLKK
jgi:hypothetical protein